MLQDHGLLPWATVRQNVGLGLTIRAYYGSDGRHAPADEVMAPDEADQRIDRWLDKLGIAELHDKYPAQLSRGQRQRTAIARTMVTRPDLLLLDEPFSALDAPTREDLQHLVMDLFREPGLVYITVTHDIEVAVAMGRQILILGKGVNSEPQIIENPSAGGVDYRLHADFRRKCDEIPPDSGNADMNQGFQIRSAVMGIGMFIVIWQILAWVVHRPILPPPLKVLPIFFRGIFQDLGIHFLASAGRVLAAIILAVIAAVPCGLVLGQMPKLDRIFAPLIAIAYPIPKIVLLPVIYVLMGITDISKIFLIALIIFFQILVVVRDEAANLRPELILSVRSLGAGRRALLRYVYFPATLPAVLTALRISVGTAIAVLFIAEQSLTSYGLGYYIVVETYQVLLYPEMYAGILAMSILGLGLYFVIAHLEYKVCRYQRNDPEQGCLKQR